MANFLLLSNVAPLLMFVFHLSTFIFPLSSIQPFKQSFQHYRCRDFAVGSFGDDEAGGRLDDVVGDNHVATHGQAVHEEGIVGECHLLGADGP